MTEAEFHIIRQHNDAMQDEAKRGLAKLREIPKSKRDEWILNQMQWFKHCVSCLKMSTARARQLAQVLDNANA